MKKLTLLITGIFLFTGNLLVAQNKHFMHSGTIEFEKNTNMYALIKKQINSENEAFYQPYYDQYVKNHPQFLKLKSTLKFGSNKTLFNPIIPESTNDTYFDDSPAASQNNLIFADYNTKTSISQKKVFEETFLVKDSLRHVKWKMTGETREILGHPCRRANGLILDTVYVVAFYAEDIAVGGGPESFNGLPGMILLVALPHENISWTATKITEIPVDDKALVPPVKGKQVNNKQLQTTLLSAMKGWGNYAQMYLKAFSL